MQNLFIIYLVQDKPDAPLRQLRAGPYSLDEALLQRRALGKVHGLRNTWIDLPSTAPIPRHTYKGTGK